MNRSTKICTISVFTFYSLSLALSTHASTWAPTSLAGAQPQVWFSTGATFTDNLYTIGSDVPDNDIDSGRFTPLFTNNPLPPTLDGNNKINIFFAPYSGTPPLVDPRSHTIDVSSIWASGYLPVANCDNRDNLCLPDIPRGTPIWDEVFGWSFGPRDPVPYVANVDGTLTATWMTPEQRAGAFETGAPFTLIFAPIPELETYAMFLAGLGLIGFILRRQQTA
jgi:hypothetical protein